MAHAPGVQSKQAQEDTPVAASKASHCHTLSRLWTFCVCSYSVFISLDPGRKHFNAFHSLDVLNNNCTQEAEVGGCDVFG